MGKEKENRIKTKTRWLPKEKVFNNQNHCYNISQYYITHNFTHKQRLFNALLKAHPLIYFWSWENRAVKILKAPAPRLTPNQIVERRISKVAATASAEGILKRR